MKKIFTLLILCCSGYLAAQNYHIGDLYTAPDGSQGIVFYVHPDGSGGWVVALNDASEGCAWGVEGDVPGLTNQIFDQSVNLMYDTAGYTNTQLIRAFQNNDPTYAAGVVDFVNGWVLPSPAQLSLIYGLLPFISDALIAAGGTTLANDSYWSSAERNASRAWVMYFNGEIGYPTKTTACRVRAVRSFTVAVEPEVSYSWSTGATTPDITVSPTQTTTYIVTVTSLDGCSDTVTHTITMISAEPQTFVAEVCQGEAYEDNGFSLTAAETFEPGVHTYTRIEDLGGCTITYTLELTVNPSPHIDIDLSACDSYEWNGQTYTENGDYTAAFPYQGGCDSVVTLHLTIEHLANSTISVSADTICEGDEVTLLVDNSSSGPVLHVPPVAVGDILCTDNSIVKPADWPVVGKTAMGIVFYVDNTGEHGWAVHLQDQAITISWGGYGSIIPSLTSYTTARSAASDLDGYSNTQKIRTAGNASTYPAAWAVDFDNGWYLPAGGQLQLLMSEYLTINNSFQILNIPQFTFCYYWPSTQYNTTQMWSTYPGGSMHTIGKNQQADYRVRSIRDF